MNNIDETGMPTDAYITVRRNEQGEVDIYVGGKPATTYYGQDILNIPFIKEVFAWMQEQNPYIKEFHVGAFATRGYKKGKTGNPSSGLDPNSWCRLKFTNGETSSWVFNYTYSSRDAYDWASHCASCCATSCAFDVRYDTGFHDAVFNAPIDKTPQPKTPMENKQQNNDMPTYAYITVKRNEQGEVDVYVGGKPATKYRGQDIEFISHIKKHFAWMQGQNPDIEEFHIGAFATPGYKRGETGNPSSGFGPHAWCRVKYKKVGYGAWVFVSTDGWAAYCANNCALYCAYNVRANAGFRAAVFHAPIEKPTVEINGRGLAQLIVNSVYGKQK